MSAASTSPNLPLVGRLAERHLPVGRVGEILLGPLPDDDLRRRRSPLPAPLRLAARTRAASGRCSRSRRRAGAAPRCSPAGPAGVPAYRRRAGVVRRPAPPGAAGGAAGRIHTLPCARGVRAAGPQRLNRVDDEGQRFELDVDRFDRVAPPSARRRRRRRGSARPRRAAPSSGRARSARSPARLRRACRRPAAPGRSSSVRIALTPGIASALLMSSRVTRACGIGLQQQLREQHAFGAVVFGVAAPCRSPWRPDRAACSSGRRA